MAKPWPCGDRTEASRLAARLGPREPVTAKPHLSRGRGKGQHKEEAIEKMPRQRNLACGVH